MNEIKVCFKLIEVIDFTKFFLPDDLVIVESLLLEIGFKVKSDQRLNFLTEHLKRWHIELRYLLTTSGISGIVITVILVVFGGISSNLHGFCLKSKYRSVIRKIILTPTSHVSA